MRFALSAQISISLLLQLIAINANLSENGSSISYAASIVSMLKLLSMEERFLANLNKYVNQLERKLKFIEIGLAQMRHLDLERNESVEMQLAKPWRVLALTRHLTIDWFQWHRVMQYRSGEEQVEFFKKNAEFLPNKNDIVEATKGIVSIRNLYNMTIDDIRRGLFGGVQYDASLNGFDCYEIGLVHFEREDFDGAIKWFDAAHNYFLSENGVIDHQALKDIYEHKLLTLWQLNRRFDALKLLNESLTLWPNDVYLKQRKSLLIQQEVYTSFLKQRHKSIFIGVTHESNWQCNKKLEPMTTLHCRYNNTNNAFLRLAPLKMEQLSLSPYVVLFHDVLYDSEIDEIKRLAMPNLKRASFPDSALAEISIESRVTHAHWLEDDTSPTTIRVNRRITDMSRFTLDDAEMLQVMNYGIGGRYLTHNDFFNSSFEDRTATVLFYLSDVTQGGSTMFPYINLKITPKKGTAILWYNLNNEGKGDEYAAHAACPVIVGSKWVMSKWIHENSQTFIKPCWK